MVEIIKWFKKEKEAVLLSNYGKEYILDSEIPNKIGRANTEHIIVEDDSSVSRHNSLLTYDENTRTYCITDRGSKYGTYVNGEKITEKRELKHGDIIGMGKYTKFTFEIRSFSPTEQAK